jgi:lysophospholipase L1-like esterase
MVRNWVFLGDSLTEGVGSKRISHVTELVKQLRSSNGMNVHEFRLRQIGAGLSRQIDFNVAGLMNVDADQSPSDLWLWNLACEGQTIEADFGWLSLMAALRPELVVIFRGSLESIIRPAMVLDEDWPWWVPRSWRGYAAMDPRCYFSTTWWRNAKQSSIDAFKQRARLKLLKVRPGKPLIDLERFASYQTELIKKLRALKTRVLMLGLLPVDEERFPGSAEHFKTVNARLKQIAEAEGVEFFDWASSLKSAGLFYLDGFHPNATGAATLARLLRERIL